MNTQKLTGNLRALIEPHNIYEEWLFLDWDTMTYSASTNLDLGTTCNQLIVKNNGTSILLIDDDPIGAGESKTFGGARKTIFRGRHRIEFKSPGVNSCIITRVYYLNVNY